MKPGREVDLGWTFTRDVWEGKIQLGHAGRVQGYLLKSKSSRTPLLIPGGWLPRHPQTGGQRSWL